MDATADHMRRPLRLLLILIVRPKMNSLPVESWGEPARGTHAIWRSDRWRYPKLLLVPLVLFAVAAWRHLDMSPTSISWLAGISGALMAYIWVWSFVPRSIRVFEDKIAIGRVGRGMSWTEIPFSEVEDVQVEPAPSRCRVRLRLKRGSAVDFYSPDESRAQRVKLLVEKNKMPNHAAEPTSPCLGGSS